MTFWNLYFCLCKGLIAGILAATTVLFPLTLFFVVKDIIDKVKKKKQNDA